MTVDAVVVGSGPNGLAAAIELARNGRSVTLYEARDALGGGVRSGELTLPGFVHDICSTVQTLALASPFLRSVPLEDLGVRFMHPERPFAHPLDGGDAAVVARSVDETAASLGRDAAAYRRLMQPLVDDVHSLMEQFLGPLRLPRHPIAMARFGLNGIRSAQSLARSRFESEAARALIGGVAAHSMMPLSMRPTAGFALVLTLLAHAVGWPVVKGGSQQLSDALGSYLRSLGGEIVTGVRIDTMQQLPPARAYLFDVTPKQLLGITAERLPARYRALLERYRYGPGVFKVDWALDAAIPWTSQECCRAGTVHAVGTLDEIADSEAAAWRGVVPEKPYVLLVQPTLFDASRAPESKHTAWAYCHVPAGSAVDMTQRIESQVERFAPGFRDTILSRHTMSASEMESYNPNYVGGDINGGVQDLLQLFTRPVARLTPYSTPDPQIFICSSSTPPGGGVHGMCGYFAAKAVLKQHECIDS